jgi:predicted phosphodiesterase
MGLVRIAFVGDLHVREEMDHVYETVDFVNSISADGVVFLGDLINTATEENLERFIEQVRKIEKPYYICIGNHDTGSAEDGFDIESKLQSRLDGPWKESFTYSFRIKGWNFITCSMTTGKIPYKGVQVNHYKGHMSESGGVCRIPEHHIKRFKELLEESGDMPTCVCIHVPLMRMYKRLFDRGCFCQVRLLEELQMLSLVESRENVKAVVCGHDHFNQVDIINGKLHCISQSVQGYPPYKDPDRIRIMEFSDTGIKSHLEWLDYPGDPLGGIGTLDGDRSFEWEFE